MPSRWLTHGIIAQPPSAPLGIGESRWASCVAGPCNLQRKLLALCVSQLQSLHLEPGVSRRLSLTSPLVAHWLICHLPGADQSPLVLLLPIHPPAFSLFCHHPISTSAALFWHPLFAELSNVCIFLVFKYSVKLLSSVESCSPFSGSVPISAEICITAASGMLCFCL